MLFVLLYHVVVELQWVVEITYEKCSNLYLRLLHCRTRQHLLNALIASHKTAVKVWVLQFDTVIFKLLVIKWKGNGFGPELL